MNEFDLMLKESQSIAPQLTRWRRNFHSHPEMGLDVPFTAETIRNELKNMNIRILEGSPENSVIAMIPGNPEGDPLALRADMDALPIQEKNDFPYCSLSDGKMHACGHDGHMAMLLGAAFLLHKRKLPQNTYFIFQPGEEDPGGAELIMKSGLLDPVKGIFALHLDPSFPSGTIAVSENRAMAATDNFFITIKGKGGHGGLPHLSVDPIAISGQLINDLQYIISRRVDPVQPTVISLGSIQGGSSPNVIPDEVHISGTIRAFSDEIRQQIGSEIREAAISLCKRYGGIATVRIIEDYPAVINNSRMLKYLTIITDKLKGKENSTRYIDPRMTAEDFSYYLQSIPGVFYWLGCSCHPDKAYPLHHPLFNPDESVFPLGTAIHSAIAMNFQKIRDL